MAAACPPGWNYMTTAFAKSYSPFVACLDDGVEKTAHAGASSSWYAVRVRPRWEQLVAAALRARQYEALLPLFRKRSRWSDRTKILELPLFPGYVFCRADLHAGPPLVTTPGVTGIVSFGGTRAVIPDNEIKAIKAVLRSGVHASPWPYLNAGQRVRIHCGALTGLEGILLHSKSDCRIVLSVDVLARSVAVEIYREWVTPVGPVSTASALLSAIG